MARRVLYPDRFRRLTRLGPEETMAKKAKKTKPKAAQEAAVEPKPTKTKAKKKRTKKK